ncbi:MAG: PH domain-containing protein [Lachnospiraceae bacterium]|nr:PH domain-containing protein [Lachnospiraceae bacterium]
MADKIVWQDRKRIIFGLPWTFTKYKLMEDKIQICTGFLNKKEEEIRLYRIMDNTLEKPLGQRIFGLGTIKCNSADKTTPVFYLARIKNADKVRNMLSDMVEKERTRKRVSGREFMSYGEMDEDDDLN